MMGLTSTFTPSLVNDFRFSYQYWHNRNLFPTATDCGSPCVGIEGLAPQISVNGSNVIIGHTSNATQGRDLRKFQFNDGLNWQKGAHRLRFGGEIELRAGHRILGLLRSDVRRGCSPRDGPRIARGFPGAVPQRAESGQHVFKTS